MEPRNQPLYEAIKKYVEAAIDLLREGEASRSPIEGQPEWTRSGDFFQQRPANVAWMDTYAFRDDLHALPEFEACREQLRADDVIAPHLGNLVGTTLSALRVDETDVIDRIFGRFLTYQASQEPSELRLDEAILVDVYRDVEDAFYSATIRHVLVAPLENFSADSLPIELDDNSEVDLLEDSEIEACLRGGILRPLGGFPFVDARDLAGFRWVFDLPKVIAPSDSTEGAKELFERQQKLVERLVLALRLVRAGQSGVSGYVTFSDSWFERGQVRFYPGSTPLTLLRFGSYELAADDLSELQEIWEALASAPVENHETLQVSLRRFSYAGDRDRADDRLVDLMISAEALFLPDESLELGYKLALRSAFFLESAGYERRETFELMKRAYSARGRIVHGGSTPNVRMPDGSQVGLGTFTATVAEYMRASLKKAIRVVTGDVEGSISAWDDLVLDGRPSS